MGEQSLTDFVLESGFYSSDTIDLYIEAMSHPIVPKSSRGLVDRLLHEKYSYDNYDICPLEDDEDIGNFLR